MNIQYYRGKNINSEIKRWFFLYAQRSNLNCRKSNETGYSVEIEFILTMALSQIWYRRKRKLWCFFPRWQIFCKRKIFEYCFFLNYFLYIQMMSIFLRNKKMYLLYCEKMIFFLCIKILCYNYIIIIFIVSRFILYKIWWKWDIKRINLMTISSGTSFQVCIIA